MKNIPVSPKNSVILGSARLPVGEYWHRSIESLAGEVVRAAVRDAGNPHIDALYIGNAFGSVLSKQANLGSLIAESSGLLGVDAVTFEADGASGACAVRAALLAVESGWVENAVAVGVEKITDVVTSEAEDAKSLALNYEYETSQGLSADGQAGLVAQFYLHEFERTREIFSSAVLNGYRNAITNPHARNRHGLSAERYAAQPPIADPLGMFDIAQLGDGAAAVVITRAENGMTTTKKPIRFLASANATARLSIHDRPELLIYRAVAESAQRSLNQASIRLKNIDLFELGDPTVIDLILSLEALGAKRPGRGWHCDTLTLNSGGGNIGRGYPVGAAGVYQLLEAADWLASQPDDRPVTAFVQALGGRGATAVSHVLSS